MMWILVMALVLIALVNGAVAATAMYWMREISDELSMVNQRYARTLITMRKQGWDTIPEEEDNEPWAITDEYEAEVEEKRIQNLKKE